MPDNQLHYADGDGAFKLWCETNSEGQSDNSLNIYWQLSEESIKWQLRHDIKHAYLMVVTEFIDGRVDTWRVIPLKKRFACIPLSASGANHIHATIIGSLDEREPYSEKFDQMVRWTPKILWKAGVIKEELDRQIRSTRMRIVSLSKYKSKNAEKIAQQQQHLEQLQQQRNQAMKSRIAGDIVNHGFSSYSFEQLGWAKLSVEMPEELFHNSSRVTKFLARHYKGSKMGKDQCQERSWAIAAIASILWYAIFTVFRSIVGLLVAAACAFMGWRNLNYRAIFPFNRQSLRDIYDYREESRWYKQRVKREGESERFVERPRIFKIIAPPTLLVIGIIGLALLLLYRTVQAAPINPWAYLSIPLGIAIGIVVMWILDRRDKLSKETTEPTQEEVLQQRIQANQAPVKAPPIYLRARAVKALICKPIDARQMFR